MHSIYKTTISRLVAFFLSFGGSFVSAQMPFPFPTDWKFELMEDRPSEWWRTLRVKMVPGVGYTLQKSETLEAVSWATVSSQYGTDGDWVCPLFRGPAPTTASTLPTPSIYAPAAAMNYAWLVVEKDLNGQVLLSWKSLDDQLPKRTRLTGIVLGPAWENFEGFYLETHGDFTLSISPQLYTPVAFGATNPPLGPIDSALIQTFISALPSITATMQNNSATAATLASRPTVTGNKAFFRVAANWNLNSDGDSRLDWQEIIFDGSNPFATDTDGDGVPDTAQDNSGPEPTLDVAPPPVALKSGLRTSASAKATAGPPGPPRATIESNLNHARVRIIYAPNDPNFIDMPDIYTFPGTEPILTGKRSFSTISDAVGTIPFLDYAWRSALSNFSSRIYKSPPISIPNSSQTGSYDENFWVDRMAFRLRLDAPAPEGGYAISLRIIHYTYELNNNPNYEDGPYSDIGYEDIILKVNQGETVGSAVIAKNNNLGPNQLTNYIVANFKVRPYGIDPFTLNFNLLEPPEDGMCLVKGIGFDARIEGYYAQNIRSYQVKLLWQKRRLSGDGSFGQWENMPPEKDIWETGADESTLHLDSRGYAYLSIHEAGIYQLQAVFSFPDGTKIPVPYLRMADGKNIQDGHDITNLNLKAGKPDYIGLCRDQHSLNIRNEALKWLGSTAYAFEKQVSIKAGNIFNPDTKKRINATYL
jgi:hypothetical protein